MRPLGPWIVHGVGGANGVHRVVAAAVESQAPRFSGACGRKSAALGDYRYSGPMTRANLVWTEANLHDYIANPQAKVKGNRMPYGGIANASDIDDIIAYLATMK
jgi:cytochrome c